MRYWIDHVIILILRSISVGNVFYRSVDKALTGKGL